MHTLGKFIWGVFLFFVWCITTVLMMKLMISLSTNIDLWLQAVLRDAMVAPAIGGLSLLVLSAFTFFGSPIVCFLGVVKLNQFVTRSTSHETQ